MTPPNIFPALKYADGAGAIEWLEEAFGFATRFKVANADGGIAHAQLQLGAGMIMTGSKGAPDPANPWSEAGMGIYVHIEDADAHHARAHAAGARTVMALHDTDYGSREYSVRDVGGHLWGFGSYEPYAGSGTTLPDDDRPNIFPALGYADGPGAIDWLERAFGVARHRVYEQPDRSIAHAELGLGAGMIMMGSKGEPDPANPWQATDMGVYVRVPDPDAHHARARAAGAVIVRPLKDTDYGSREYSARDAEGYLWSFGTYDPYQEE